MTSSIQVVERALDILSLISENEAEMGVSQIARIMGLHKSTVYRTVYTMNKKEYLYKNERTSEYSLGKKAFLIGFRATSNIPAAKVARPYMAFLSEKYNEHVELNIFEKGHILTISYYLGNYSNTFYRLDNQRRIKSPYKKAIIYCMLANQINLEPNNQLLLEYINNGDYGGKNSIESLIKDLKKVQDNGYACEIGETYPREVCYAATIFNPPAIPGRAVATISIAGDKNKISNFPEEELIRDIRNAASMITDLWKPIAEIYSEEFQEQLD